MTLTWETVADWDDAQSETGVVHENAANTDHGTAADLMRGYSAASPLDQSNLVHMYLLHEDSGSTIHDLAGSLDGAVNGNVDLDQSGLLGGTSLHFEQGEYVRFDGISSAQQPVTCLAWVDYTGEENAVPFANHEWTNCHGQRKGWALFAQGDGTMKSWFGGEGSFTNSMTSTGTLSFDTPQHFGFTLDADGNVEHYINGSLDSSHSIGFDIEPPVERDATMGVHSYNCGNRDTVGNVLGVWIYDTVLSPTAIQTHYDVAATPGHQTTGVKSP